MRRILSKALNTSHVYFRRAGIVLNEFSTFFELLRLARKKGYQRQEYEAIRDSFLSNYEMIKDYPIDNFMTPAWRQFNAVLESSIIPIQFSFLRNPVIAYTMFVSGSGPTLTTKLKFLESILPKQTLKRLLMEDYMGNPKLIRSNYLTSHNSVHHLYHIMRFQKATHIDWGG